MKKKPGKKKIVNWQVTWPLGGCRPWFGGVESGYGRTQERTTVPKKRIDECHMGRYGTRTRHEKRR